MVSDQMTVNDYELKVYSLNSLIIGSGAAALNAAVSLHRNGVTDIMIMTSQFGGGTSNNAGSDKQTYYKLSLCGKEPDSVIDMARDLFNGKCMHGDIALCEAQGSVQSFMRLVELGVRFPKDKYGSFAGYTTDHDPRSRATSAGPYTSRMMFEALASEVKKRDIKVLDSHQCISLITDKTKTRVIGAIAIDTTRQDPRKAFVLINSQNIVYGTGGPAGIYETSVYPHSQSGSTGIALMAGTIAQNLTESQFGLASVKFRWNLSGSYQQVIPRYISTAQDGSDEREFLNDHFPSFRALTKAIFLKGYQWPFDPRKIRDFGSSLIDVLVDREINLNNRKVFLDYSRNPSGKNGEIFNTSELDQVAGDYLLNSGALGDTPYKRLQAMNQPAIDLYMDHNIDLGREYLQIAVCAQHNNGGLKGNIWWESNIKHLFPVGEVNGSHGVYRPGGSALNSGQVGSARAAEFISKKYNHKPLGIDQFINEAGTILERTLNLSDQWLDSGTAYREEYLHQIRRRMSSAAGITRSGEKVTIAVNEARDLLDKLPGKLGATNVGELAGCYLQVDHCVAHFVYLRSIEYYIKNGGRSRGSYIISESLEDGKDAFSAPELCDFTREAEKCIIEVSFNNNLEVSFNQVVPSQIPDQNLWFEKVWKEYLEDISMLPLTE
jgi:succinate dehydrogenase/fumarate reductase flavoprotein subunit